jgi:putative pyruvate formate lyase activating enzyme
MPKVINTIPLNLPKYRYLITLRKLNLLTNKLYSQLKKCCLCPRHCKVNRLKGEKGFCLANSKVKVYSYLPHLGEEPPISGQKGSGTIFFSNCSLRCVYCQNYKFSQLGQGREVEIEELAQIMLKLQEEGCHNLNLVTPAHYIPQILQALVLAIKSGLNIPIVYNTSGYENISTLNYLENVVDIYLADMRYGTNAEAKIYSYAPNYVEINQKAIKTMYRQVGNLMLNEGGLAQRGLIIRHLVLPENISGAEKVLNFITKNISLDTYISLMAQYTPAYKAQEYLPLSRRITPLEYDKVIELMPRLGLNNGWIQVITKDEPYFSDTGMNLRPTDPLT